MCTAITFHSKDHYFGRNLDLEYHYRETVTITPRNYPFPFRNGCILNEHYAMIGVAMVTGGYPLYYDATNEHGLSMAGLNFPGNAAYQTRSVNLENITPFELIPWILGTCKNISEAEKKLQRINIWEQAFSDNLPLTPLHWLLADRERAIVLEPMEDDLRIHEDPVGVLTNNPPFPYHMWNLSNYRHLSPKEPENHIAPGIALPSYSRGMGGIGLPGDLSSASRFVRAAFTKLHSHCGTTEAESVTQFFHILGAVAQQEGCVQLETGYEKTVYTSCCNADKGIYYYKTYENSQITGIDMHRENLDSCSVISYPLITEQQIRMGN